MIRPYNEREAWAHEGAELPEQIAAYQRDLAAPPAEQRAARRMRAVGAPRLAKRAWMQKAAPSLKRAAQVATSTIRRGLGAEIGIASRRTK